MGHHLNEKQFFQSDKHPELPENKIILDFKDPCAQKALMTYAMCTKDSELSEDIQMALAAVKIAGLTEDPD